GGVGGLHGAVGGGAGVEHLLPAPAVIVPARGGTLHRIHRALGRLASDLLRRALDPLGEEIAEALAVADHLDELVGAVHVAPIEAEADLVLREISLLHALHHPPAHPAELGHLAARPPAARLRP